MKEVSYYTLYNGKSKSCGCFKLDWIAAKKKRSFERREAEKAARVARRETILGKDE